MSPVRNASWQAKHDRLIRVEQLSREALETAEAGLTEPRPVPPTPVSTSVLHVTSAGILHGGALSDWRGPVVNALAQAAFAARAARIEHERGAS